jgi:hypothetical protein
LIHPIRFMNTSKTNTIIHTIKKEEATRAKWMEKYAKDKLREERKLLIEALKKEKHELHKSNKARALLYDGVSKEGKGRAAYLEHQRSISPTKKYKSPITSSQEIGWRVEGYSGERPEHGRRAIIQDTFYRKRGVFNEEL